MTRFQPGWTLGAAAALETALVLGSGAFPSGADVGNQVHHGRLVAEGRWSELHYPPLVPLFSAVVWAASGHDVGAAAALFKVVPFGLMLMVGAASASLAAAVTGNPRTRAWAFAFGCVNSMAATALAWGGNPFVAAAAFSLLGLAAGIRTLRTGQGAWIGPGWACMALLSNPYPVLCALLAFVGLHLAEPSLRHPDHWKRLLPGSAAATALGLAVYVPLQAGLKGGLAITRYGPGAIVEAMAMQARDAGWHWLVPVGGWLVLLAATRRGRWRLARPWALMAGAALAGALVIQSLTLMNLGGRSLYVVALLASPAAGAAAASLVADRQASVAQRALWARPVGVTILLAVALVYGAALSSTDRDYYSPLGPQNWSVLHEVGAGRGAVLVAAPTLPTFDAWWLRGVTGRVVLVAGEPWFHLSQADKETNRLANDFLDGTAGFVAGPVTFQSGGCTGKGVRMAYNGDYVRDSLWVIPDDGVQVVTGAGAQGPLRWDQTVAGGAIVDRAMTDAGMLERRLEWPTGATLAFRLPDGQGRLAVSFFAPPGGTWRFEAGNGDGFAARLESAGRPRGVPFAVTSAVPAAVTLDPAGHWARIEADVPAGGAPWELRLFVSGVAQAPELHDFFEDVKSAGADVVYDRGSSHRARLDADLRLEGSASQDPATALYRLHPGPAGCR